MIIDLIFVEIGNLLCIKCVIITYRKAHINLVQSVGFLGLVSLEYYLNVYIPGVSCLTVPV